MIGRIFSRLFSRLRNKNVTPIGTDLNKSPRQVNINEARSTKFSNTSNRGFPTFTPLQKGGSVIARGNKLTRNKPTQLY
jgi:hypothetical protein